ncbi:hypothetical protein PMEGAPR185_27860 [Priestia megaterium]
MSTIEIILLNIKEIRRRSIKIWEAIPQTELDWKPDKEAMTYDMHGDSSTCLRIRILL